MQDRSTSGRLIMVLRSLLLIVTILAAVASLVPLLGSNAWWVRYPDFARLQLAVALVALIAASLAAGAWRSRFGWGVVLLGLAALWTHTSRLFPYAPLVDPMALAVRDCPAPSRLRLLVANVLKGDESADQLLAHIGEAAPDVVLLLETNAWWDEALRPLHDAYPHRVQHIPEAHPAYGIHLMSRLPLAEPQVLFWFDALTPTVMTDVILPGGDRVRFVGLHPRPPLPPDQSSIMRDAHVLKAALLARGSDLPTILAGDLNAVPWEPVVRRALRVGGLLDPRVGRGLYPTFDATSWWMAWPLDQVLHQDAFGLVDLEVLPAWGSDHRPVRADLCLEPGLAAQQAAPDPSEGDLERAKSAIRAAELLAR